MPLLSSSVCGLQKHSCNQVQYLSSIFDRKLCSHRHTTPSILLMTIDFKRPQVSGAVMMEQWWWKGFEQSCSNKHFCHRQNMERAIGSWRNLGVVNRCGWAGACMGLVGFPDSPFRLTSQVASQLVRCSRLVCARINIAGHSMLRLECHRDNLDSL